MKGFIFSSLMLLAVLLTDAQPISTVDSFKHLISIAKPDTNKVYLLWSLSWEYLWTRSDSAIIFGQEGLALARQIHYTEGEAKTKHVTGLASWLLGDYLQADKMLLDAEKFAESKHDTSWLMGLYTSICANKRDKGDYRDALNYSFKAYHLNKSWESFNEVTGSIYLEMNMTDSAFYYLKHVEASCYTLWLLGRNYEKTGDSKLAYRYYLQSISDSVANEAPSKDLSSAYNSLAELFKKENKIDSCIYYATKAYGTAYDGSYTKGMWEAALLLSTAYENRDPGEALHYFKMATAAKDSLFNLQKTTQFLNSQFNEQLQQQQEEANKISYRNKIRTYMFLAALVFFLLIAINLYRNNKRKQRAKIEIEKAYTALKSTQSQLIQKEKMASLGELTAGIAHEIQNPLNFVNNFSEVSNELIDELKDERKKEDRDFQIEDEILNDIRQNLEKINHHGKRADAIVKGMLQHSQAGSGQKELTNINKLTDEYLRLAYQGLRAKDKTFNATLQTDFDDSLSAGNGKINIIPQDIGRVLLNLYNNAFYTVAEKKKLIGENYEPTVSVSTKKLNDKIEIKVGDNGNGIPQKVVDKIFQPFFTTKPTGQGTGLGLSLSYDIIKAHGGEIKVETKEDEGSEFIIQLPTT